MELLAEIVLSEPEKYSQVQLKQPDIQLDLYKLARRRGLLVNHAGPQLRQYLISGFQAMLSKLHELVPELTNGSIFPNIPSTAGANRPCFNYMSQWLRLPLLKCLSYCIPEDARAEFDISGLHKMDNPAHIPIYKKIFNYLILLHARSAILWFFFQVPNYCDYNITGYRTVYEAMCLYLIEAWPKHLQFKSDEKQPFEIMTLGTTYYYNLVYHGQSNKHILTLFSNVLRHIYPELIYKAGHLASNPARTTHYLKQDKGQQLKKCLELFQQEYLLPATSAVNSDGGKNIKPGQIIYDLNTYRRIKVIFISNKLLTYTSVFRDRIGIITNLDKRYFDVWIGLFGDENVIKAQIKSDSVASYFLDNLVKNERVIFLSKIDVIANQKEISTKAFDIVFYPDLGMVQAQTLLAHARLAPIQITTWGHSDTSGNPEIDYYITSKWFEQTEDLSIPKSNYSEKVILLNSMGTYYYSPRKIIKDIIMPPDPESQFIPITRLGFTVGGQPIVIGCLQSFYKFNEEFEAILESIMKLTEPMSRGGYIVYLALSNSITFNKKHLARLNKRLGPYTSRIKWFQNKSPVDWLNLISVCHILIDPFPFGGCNTSLEAFDYGIPVVCYPSKTMINGRFTSGFYKKMGINNCIVETPVQFCQQVMRLIQDDVYYEFIKKQIQNAKERLFEDKESIIEYQNVFYNLVNKHYSLAG